MRWRCQRGNFLRNRSLCETAVQRVIVETHVKRARGCLSCNLHKCILCVEPMDRARGCLSCTYTNVSCALNRWMPYVRLVSMGSLFARLDMGGTTRQMSRSLHRLYRKLSPGWVFPAAITLARACHVPAETHFPKQSETGPALGCFSDPERIGCHLCAHLSCSTASMGPTGVPVPLPLRR